MINAARDASARGANPGLWIGPVAALTVAIVLPLPGLALEGRLVLATLALMAIWWVSEAIPLPATALVPIVALPLMGLDVSVNAAGQLVCAVGACREALGPEAQTRAFSVADLAAHYANPIVLLYIGGFLLGVAIDRWGLSKRFAYLVVARAGASPKLMIAGFVTAAGAMSMWISNTSTAMILTPLALSVAAGAGAGERKFAGALALAVAYAATIGGLATPIGTPTNGIAIQQLAAQGVEVSFGAWVAIGLPITLILLPAAWWLLSRDVRLDPNAARAAQEDVRAKLTALGPIGAAERRVLVIFAAMALGWLASTLLAPWLARGLGLGRLSSAHLDVIVSTLGALAFFGTPSGAERARALLTWDDAKDIPWGILLLFGGGLAIAAAADLSGLSAWLAGGLTALTFLPPIVLILLVGLLVIVITEFASNIATISLMGPVLLSLAAFSGELGVAAFVVPAAIAASLGFAMPVGSAANAIAYATGALDQSRMIAMGLKMNAIALVVVTGAAVTLAPLVLGGR